MTIAYAGYRTPYEMLAYELEQLAYEGYCVPEAAREALAQLNATTDAFNHEKLAAVHALLVNLPRRPDFHYVQPNDLEAIRKERPDGPRHLSLNLSDDELLDRLHGAWTGRACGCALGKPVEGMGMSQGRPGVKRYLQNRNHWPLDFYFSGADAGDGLTISCKASWRENIAFMEPDDDIHYSLIGLQVLESIGRDFQWYHVANAWNSLLPYNAICSAETQAILNYNMTTPNTWSRGQKPPATTPAFTRRHNNPYREWIGAQIRADGWAFCCAGNPELAAEFAWRDACWTHTANGIYGEMFVAAVIAAAFVEHDPKRLVEIGLSEIPKNCRLAEDIRWTLATIPSCPDFEAFMDLADRRFAGMSPVHTNNNAVIVVMSLFYGGMQPDKSICVSVMGALDTDCNGATTGSIVGAVAGKKAFGGKLHGPLNDTIKPNVFGFQAITMEELAARTLAVHKKIRAQGMPKSAV